MAALAGVVLSELPCEVRERFNNVVGRSPLWQAFRPIHSPGNWWELLQRQMPYLAV